MNRMRVLAFERFRMFDFIKRKRMGLLYIFTVNLRCGIKILQNGRLFEFSKVLLRLCLQMLYV